MKYRAPMPYSPVRAAASAPSPPRVGVVGRAWWAALIVSFLVAGGGVYAFLASPPSYSRRTPEDVIASARRMLERGEVRYLPLLVHAESEPMRAFLNRTGLMLQSLHDLGVEIQRSMPQEIARVREQAGKEPLSLQNLMGQGEKRRGRPDPRAEQAMQNALTALAADPYAWLRASEGRLGTARVSDTMVALTWDGGPVLAPFGVVMQKYDDGWAIVPPTNLPLLAPYMPKTKGQWSVWGSGVAVVHNTLEDLRREVRQGQITTFDQLARRAGERAFVPMAMIFWAIRRSGEAGRPN